MASNIEKLARDPEMRAAHGAAGRREAELRFDSRANAAAFAAAYERLVNAS
jgi:glycosyltransferase involved in cell wall biosynthesis